MKTLQVKRYNDEIARVKQQEALTRWRLKKDGYGYPVKSMFFFQLEDEQGYPTEERQKGYVAFEGGKACFGITEKEAIKEFNK